MSNLVVDASVAIKWVVNESDSAAAQGLIGAKRLAAPEFLMLECANALWAIAKRKIIASADATRGLAMISAAPVDLHPIAPHIAAAQAIALEIDRTVYDCLYLALSISLGAPLMTADERFAKAVEAHAVYKPYIRRLGA